MNKTGNAPRHNVSTLGSSKNKVGNGTDDQMGQGCFALVPNNILAADFVVLGCFRCYVNMWLSCSCYFWLEFYIFICFSSVCIMPIYTS